MEGVLDGGGGGGGGRGYLVEGCWKIEEKIENQERNSGERGDGVLNGSNGNTSKGWKVGGGVEWPSKGKGEG